MSTSITPEDYLCILEYIRPKDIEHSKCSNEYLEPTPERCLECDTEFNGWCVSCEDIMLCATCDTCPACQTPDIDIKQKMKAILQPTNIELKTIELIDGYSRDYYRMGKQCLVSGVIKSCDETGLAADNVPIHFIHVEESMPGYSGKVSNWFRFYRFEQTARAAFDTHSVMREEGFEY